MNPNKKEIKKVKGEIALLEDECKNMFKKNKEHCMQACSLCSIYKRKVQLEKKLKHLEDGYPAEEA